MLLQRVSSAVKLTSERPVGKRSKKRKRRQRRNQRRRHRRRNQLEQTPRTDQLSVILRIGELEIVRGYDGPLRGHPEPRVVIATYHCVAPNTTLLSRNLVRYHQTQRAPIRLQPDTETTARSVPMQRGVGTIVALVVAIEEDDGFDLQDLYAALTTPEEIVIWELQGNAAPFSLENLAEFVRPHTSTRVGLRVAGGPPIDAFQRDDYVGTAAMWLPNARTRSSFKLRIPIASKDARNDWVMHLGMHLV